MIPIVIIFIAAAVALFILLRSKLAKFLVLSFVVVVFGVVIMTQGFELNKEGTQKQNIVSNQSQVEAEKYEVDGKDSNSEDWTSDSDNDKKDEDKTDNDKQGTQNNTQNNAQSNSTQTVGLKAMYLQELANLEAKTDNMFDGYTTVEMVSSASNIYKLWDDELNKIYGVLKTQLSESEMNVVRQKQRNWISYRDSKAQQDAAEFAGGSMEGLELVMSKVNTTQQRCYELVNLYLK